ncbi:MAG: hypothetical protein PHV18_14780 [Lachnospiraceae bacterium]|nr:hypothetical protein [Lachnospiraceae bacterium]
MRIKITRRLLDEYRKLKREIPLLELELREMQQGDNGFNNSTIFDYRTGEPRPQSVVGFDWPLYERREMVVKNKKAKCKAVEKWIDAIEDGQTRCVFRMFYIDGMSWEKIAGKTGYASSPDYPRLYIRDKYLRDNAIS